MTNAKKEKTDSVVPGKVSIFWEKIAARSERVPREESAKLPRDLAENFEHYMYGSPKQKR